MNPLYVKIKSFYNMTPHPEGGHFTETYRSHLEIDTKGGKRNSSTAIHFLLARDEKSHFHRLKSDEGWHFHLGAPLRLLEISPEGKMMETEIGPDFEKGQKLQHFVPAGNWFASTTTGDFSFVGCTVSPGFVFEDFEMSTKKQLIELFPHITDDFLNFSLE